MRLMAPTSSQRQPASREAGWEGSPRQMSDLTNRNRIEGGLVRASCRSTAKPYAIKGLRRRCGRCARKADALIRGGLDRGPRCPAYRSDRSWGRADGRRRKAPADGRGVSSGHSSGGDRKSHEGPNAKQGTDEVSLRRCDSKRSQPAKLALPYIWELG